MIKFCDDKVIGAGGVVRSGGDFGDVGGIDDVVAGNCLIFTMITMMTVGKYAVRTQKF